MKLEIKKIKLLFLGLTVLLLPFNGLPYFYNLLGELSNEGFIFPFAIGLFLLWIILCRDKKFHVSKASFYVLLISFVLWILLSGIMNFDTISINVFKGRSGIEKFSLQFLLISLLSTLPYVIYLLFRNEKKFLFYVRKFFIFSIITVCIYSTFELLTWFDHSFISLFINKISIFIRGKEIISSARITSVSGEASWFGIYLASAVPWLLSQFSLKNTQKYGYNLLLMYILFLGFLTYSRTVYLVIFFEITIYYILIKIKHVKQRPVIQKTLIISLIAAILFSMMIMTGWGMKVFNSSSSMFTNSNIARLGSTTAAYSVFQTSPIWGVGAGQYGFYASEHIAEWAQDNSEIISWTSDNPGTAWPPVHNLYARILAETGLVGFITWLLIWIFLLLSVLRKYLYNTKLKSNYSALEISLIVSIIGLLFVGFSSDSFRHGGYWLTFGISLVYLNQYQNKLNLLKNK